MFICLHKSGGNVIIIKISGYFRRILLNSTVYKSIIFFYLRIPVTGFDGGFMEKKRSNFFSARNVCILAVLVALVIVLQLWGSMIPIGVAGLNLSFVLIPITLGAMLLGPIAGLILGFVFGFVVLMTGVTGSNFFTAYLLADSPFFTVLTCLVKGMAAGAVAGLLYNLIKKKNKYVAVFVASAVVPVLNTGLFILGCLCMSGTIQAFTGSYMPEYFKKFPNL